MHTAGPAARASHAFDKFAGGAADASLAGVDEFGVFHPADPLIAGELSDVVPCCERLSITA